MSKKFLVQQLKNKKEVLKLPETKKLIEDYFMNPTGKYRWIHEGGNGKQWRLVESPMFGNH